jgi:protein involved in polysaccharide export with SLBB domain
MVMVVDDYFLHRSRNLELKDGNPLNEVRVICNSLRDNDGMMAADKQIKMDPDSSVLKLQVGDEINLSIDDLQRLSEAFLSEIERKYP